MQLKIGMPEILILFSLVIYSQSFTFSVIAFCLGLFTRGFDYIAQYSVEMKRAETLNQSLDEVGTAFKDIFGGKKD